MGVLGPRAGGRTGSQLYLLFLLSLLLPVLGFLRGRLWSCLVVSSTNTIYFSGSKIFLSFFFDAIPVLSFPGLLLCAIKLPCLVTLFILKLYLAVYALF